MHKSGGVPLKIKIGYGIGDVGNNLLITIIGFYLLYYLTDIVGIAAGLAGTAIMIGKVWDAVTDPAVGYLSDFTRSPMGRRRPYLLFGSFFVFIAMILLFSKPDLEREISLFLWAAGMFCLLSTAYTLVNIPYGAMLPEITKDFNEKTVITGFKSVMSIIGTFIGAGTVLPVVNLLTNTESGWRLMGAIMGGVCLATMLVTFSIVREPVRSSPLKSYKSIRDFFRSYYSVIKLQTFRRILFPWVLNMAGTTMIQGVFLYYFTYVYGNDDIFKKALPFLMLSIIAFIPLWVSLSKKMGKKNSFCFGMTVFALALLFYSLFGHILGVWFTFVIMGFAGFGSATQYVLPHAILPDVIEYDYAENGVRREGVFYGMWTFSSKLGQAAAMAMSGWILSLFNYVPNSSQTAEAQLGIKLLLGPIPVVMFITGVLILASYPIDEQFYADIMKKIKSREAEQVD